MARGLGSEDATGLFILNSTLTLLSVAGRHLEVEGSDYKPEFFIEDTDYMQHRKYGWLRRAPELAGKFVVEGFMHETRARMIRPHAILCQNDDRYGLGVVDSAPLFVEAVSFAGLNRLMEVSLNFAG